jgi:hypothetical protein
MVPSMRIQELGKFLVLPVRFCKHSHKRDDEYSLGARGYACTPYYGFAKAVGNMGNFEFVLPNQAVKKRFRPRRLRRGAGRLSGV